MNDLISIVIPIYNVEQYLCDCLSSLIEQSYQNLEIILINDGSTDGSGMICDQYASRDDRIMVIHKKNGGQSEARNMGIGIAKGKYLMFVDSDDVVTSNYVERLYSTIVSTGADIACSTYKKIYATSELQIEVDTGISPLILSNVSSVEKMLYQSKIFYTNLWGKIFKKEMWNGVAMPVGMYYEDLGTMYKIFLKANKVVGINDPLYGYRIRKGSIMRQRYDPRKLSAIPISRELYDYITENYPELKVAAATRCFSVNRAIFWQLSKRDEGYDDLWIELCKYRKTVIWNSSARVRDRIMALISMLGKNIFHLFSVAYRIQQMLKI